MRRVVVLHAAACARNQEDTGGHCKVTRIVAVSSPVVTRRARQMIEKPVQSVEPAVFESLESGTVLLINSSHAVRTGGDMNYLVLEVMARRKPRAILHSHDIYVP